MRAIETVEYKEARQRAEIALYKQIMKGRLMLRSAWELAITLGLSYAAAFISNMDGSTGLISAGYTMLSLCGIILITPLNIAVLFGRMKEHKKAYELTQNFIQEWRNVETGLLVRGYLP